MAESGGGRDPMAAPLPLRKVFHKIITSGHQRLQPLFDCLLTIVVNGKGPRARLPRAHHQVALGHRPTGLRSLVQTGRV